MKSSDPINLLRAETLSNNSIALGDYPVRLLTRRTFALTYAPMLNSRGTAPQRIVFRRAARPPA